MNNWQPIETAPKDAVKTTSFHDYGPSILVWPAFGEVTCARWWQSRQEKTHCNFIDDGGNAVHPTHWMPLPSPPAGGAEGQR